MAARLNPYISFDGNAREAMEFYKTVFGGTLVINTFGEFGMKDADHRQEGHARHARGRQRVHADGLRPPPGMPYNPGDNITISLSGDDRDLLRGYWEKLPARATSPCRWRSRCGATSSASAGTSSASPGWSTSPSPRRELGRYSSDTHRQNG